MNMLMKTDPRYRVGHTHTHMNMLMKPTPDTANDTPPHLNLMMKTHPHPG